MATTTTERSAPSAPIVPSQGADWVAVIYDPTRLPAATDPLRLIVGGNDQPIPCHPILIGLPIEEVGNLRPKDKKDPNRASRLSRSIGFSPGVTMGVKAVDYTTAHENSPRLRELEDNGVIRCFTPESAEMGVGYRAFSEPDALTLVSYSYAPSLMEDWLQGENRPVVLKLATEHRQKLEAELERRSAQ